MHMLHDTCTSPVNASLVHKRGNYAMPYYAQAQSYDAVSNAVCTWLCRAYAVKHLARHTWLFCERSEQNFGRS